MINHHLPKLLLLAILSSYTTLAVPADEATEANAAYSQLQEGMLPGAETTFQKMAGSRDPAMAIKGEEGLAETELRRGKIIEASQRIDKVIKKAPKRTMARTIKAKLLYKQGQPKAAAAELAHAAKGTSDFPWQKASVHTLQGNLYRKQKQPTQALAAYQQALREEPQDRDALTNMGVTLQELGQPQAAIKAFSQLTQSHPGDRLGAALLRQAQAAIAQQQDLEKQRYINQLVKDLVTRYQQQTAEPPPADDWTSPALALSILGFSEANADDLAGRAGLELVLQEALTQQLQAANIRVVERAVLDKVMSELNLGASPLADPDAAVKLGKIIAARLIATGSITAQAEQKVVNLRLIDTETTDIVLPLSEQQTSNVDPSAITSKFTQAITTMIKTKYPLKGRIAQVDGDSVIINLGKKHNITPGMRFNVLGEQEETIELNGKVLGTRQTKVGQLEISSVEDLMAYAHPLNGADALAKNLKIIQTQ